MYIILGMLEYEDVRWFRALLKYNYNVKLISGNSLSMKGERFSI